MKKTNVTVSLAVLAALCGPVAALAETFPERAITVVVAYPAGGGTDVIARAISEGLSKRVGQPVVIENRPGASGMIGSDYVARAEADGYTIMYTAADTHSINPHVYPSVTYDAINDFTAIAQAGNNPFGFGIGTGIPATDVASFVAYAKEKGGTLAYSSWGVGSSAHVAAEMFALTTGIKMRHVPYQGAAPALTGVMSGEVAALLAPRTVIEPSHNGGKVRMIASMTDERSATAPDVPTLKEAGIDLTIAPWQGFLGPKGIPDDRVAYLNAEINAVLADPALAEALGKNGLMINSGSPAQFDALLAVEFERWGNVIKEAGIKAE